eukprot:736824-Amphidinium_carterae.1
MARVRLVAKIVSCHISLGVGSLQFPKNQLSPGTQLASLLSLTLLTPCQSYQRWSCRPVPLGCSLTFNVIACSEWFVGFEFSHVGCLIMTLSGSALVVAGAQALLLLRMILRIGGMSAEIIAEGAVRCVKQGSLLLNRFAQTEHERQILAATGHRVAEDGQRARNDQ